MTIRVACAALALWSATSLAEPPPVAARMEILHNQDVTGKVLKKLGLPDRTYCWTECVQNAECTAVRWGVVKGDTAGLCVLLKGELQYRKPVNTTTDDGTQIIVTTARKTPAADHPRS